MERFAHIELDDGDIEVNYRLVQILESPNLVKLQFLGNVHLEGDTKLPSCFQKIEELHSKYISSKNLLKDEFYSLVATNENLRVLNLELEDKEDFVGCTKFIHCKKDDTTFQLTLDCSSVEKCLLGDFNFIHVFREFGESIVASKSTIRLRLSSLTIFIHLSLKEIPSVSRQLLSLIESVDDWCPTAESVSEMHNLILLKKLEVIFLDRLNVDIELLTLPPSLKELVFSKGFPARARLPVCLTSLHLAAYEGDANSLVDSFNFLGRHCPELESLEVQWDLPRGTSAPLNFEIQAGKFPKLRRLEFNVNCSRNDVDNCQFGLANALDWRTLQLQTLEFSLNVYNNLPVIGEELLRQICEGPSGKSLLTIQLEKIWVVSEAAHLWERLQSLVSANIEKQQQNEEE